MLNFLLEIAVNSLLFLPGGKSRPNLVFVILITASVLTLATAAIIRGTFVNLGSVPIIIRNSGIPCSILIWMIRTIASDWLNLTSSKLI